MAVAERKPSAYKPGSDDPTQLTPFDPLDPVFYSFTVDTDLQANRRLLAQAKIAVEVFDVASRGLSRFFAPTPMSNGLLSYKYILRNEKNARRDSRDGWLTTQDMKNQIANNQLMDRVIHQNRIGSNWRADKLERRYPKMAMVNVADFEGPLREVRSNPALSGNASWQDPIFEAFWVRLVRITHGMGLDGDHAASRNANAEEIETDMIQAGFRDDTRKKKGLPPGRKYAIMDDNHRPVSLYDRAHESAKHIFDVVEHGFKTEFAVNALLARFQIHDWLKGPDHGPLDMAKVHPALKNRPQAEIDKMDKLKDAMLPYLADKCMSWFPQEGEKYRARYVREEVLPRAGWTTPDSCAAIHGLLFSHRPRGGTNEFLHAGENFSTEMIANDNRLVRDFAASARTVKRRGTDGKHFRDHADLFDDKQRTFDKLQVWEQAISTYASAACEIHRMPEEKPTVWLYLNHPKGGEPLRAWMDEKGVYDVQEAQGATDPLSGDPSFHSEVIEKNVRADKAAVNRIRKSRAAKDARVGKVMTYRDFLEIGDIIDANPAAVAAQDKEKGAFSPDAKFVTMMDYFDRNVQGLVLRKGWECRPDEVKMVVRAVQHAVGLIDRNDVLPGGTRQMPIALHDPEAKPGREIQPQTLYDLISTLESHLNKIHDKAPASSVADQYVGLLRLQRVADMMGDPGEMNFERKGDGMRGHTKANELVDWSDAGWQLIRFWYESPEKKTQLLATPGRIDGEPAPAETLRDRTRRIVLGRIAEKMSPEDFKGLDAQFEARHTDLVAEREREAQRRNERERKKLKLTRRS